MKIVLDTNILINGFRDDYSYEKKIIDAVIAGEIEAYANKQTLRENRLLAMEIISSPDYEQELNKFFGQLNHVAHRQKIYVVRDPEDNKILESAMEAGAEYLITNDNDLLRLEEYQDIQIVNPSEFWVRYKDEGQDLWKQWTSFIRNRGN